MFPSSSEPKLGPGTNKEFHRSRAEWSASGKGNSRFQGMKAKLVGVVRNANHRAMMEQEVENVQGCGWRARGQIRSFLKTLGCTLVCSHTQHTDSRHSIPYCIDSLDFTAKSWFKSQLFQLPDEGGWSLKLFELHLSLCEMETLFLYCIIIFRASLYPMEQEAIHLGRRIQKRETVNLPIFYCLAVPFEFLFSFRRDNGYDMDEKTGLKPSFKCAINNVRQVLE